MDTLLVRDERPIDIPLISELTRLAFQNHPFSQHTEQFIISELRDAGALSVSLVAELDGKVAGHIAFSPLAISDGTSGWYGLGPVSVQPERQRMGIGSRLVEAGLSRVKDIGGRGCALVGDPAYYGRFGFMNRPGLVHAGIPQEVFLALSLEPPSDAGFPTGTVGFHAAFLARPPA
ncbi:MAG: N-acetyltransferase [Deltaproteobacteria bacterium]|jgi:putative acetyltransferase|nr:N-acetyltransferase [Deltaproteobacteria bacterium]